MRPSVLVLHVPGTNRDHDAAEACARAGGDPEILTIGELLSGARKLDEFRMFLLPGGFSFGDDLGAGQVWALALRHQLKSQVESFIRSGRPVLGICNGFQALMKAGLFPTASEGDVVFSKKRPATLTHNASGRFECRWVRLEPQASSPCVFTRHLDEVIECPVAHGEGRVAVRDEGALDALVSGGQIALKYVADDGAEVGYPANPNGSVVHIAGLCNPAGNVMGMMPHPEDHIYKTQHPHTHRGYEGGLGLALFKSGVQYAASI